MSTRELIIEKASQLFLQNGYDSTSINNILDAVDIGKGTLYHYFKSKEDVLDAVIEDRGNKILERVKESILIKEDIYEKLTAFFISLNLTSTEDDDFLKGMHKTQNALLEEKSNIFLLKYVSPILSDLIKEGISKEIFNNDYPEETSEMIIFYSMNTFNNDDSNDEYLLKTKIPAFIYNLNRLLGDKTDRLSETIKSIFASIRMNNMGENK